MLLSGGCGGKDAPPISPSAPSSTQEQDALWALAPEGSVFGLVVSPRGLELLEHGEQAIHALLATAPELAEGRKKLDEELTKVFGTPVPTFAGIGLAHDHGFAAFATKSGGVVMAIPVVDRDKFVALVHGKRGADADTMADTTCKSLSGRYICTDKPTLFAALGRANLAGGLAAAGSRGEIEAVYAAGAKEPGVAVAAQASPGGIVVRAAISHVPSEVTSAIGAPSKPRDGSATAAGFGLIDLSPFTAHLPGLPIAPGVTLADLGKTIAGPVTLVLPAGRADLDLGIRVPLSDPGPMKTLLARCAELPTLAKLGAKLVNGACHMVVPMSQIAIDAWVEGKELRIGSRTSAPQVALSPTPLASELAQGQWSVVSYGRGSLVQPLQVPALPALLKSMPAEAMIALRAALLVNEIGIGLRRDGDTLHVVFGVRTAWSNPDDVVKKLETVPLDQALTDAQVGKSIAAASPGSPFAEDLKAGPMGMAVSVAPIGAMFAVAIPAFMDYMKRSKQTEASLQLNKLGKSAKRFYAENAAYPVGHVALTPKAACCAGPSAHCPVDTSTWKSPVWQQLEFEINEPTLFQYSYDSDGKTFTAKAVGDLDCDGTAITYELRGTIGDNNSPKTQLIEPPPDAD